MAEVNRKLRARQTRARIAAAAARLFAERGYQGTPMDAIAAEAGVAVQTVYFAFRTKPELLVAAYDQAVFGSLDAPHPDRQDWFLRTLAEPDATKALRHFVEGAMGILLRSGPLHPVMVSSSEQEIRRAFQDRQDGRYEAYRRVVQALLEQGSIKLGLDERKATDLLYALLSPELYSLLCTERGWTPDQFKTWVSATLDDQLLRDQEGRTR
jgi:AcrR family transcriptional regulator